MFNYKCTKCNKEYTREGYYNKHVNDNICGFKGVSSVDNVSINQTFKMLTSILESTTVILIAEHLNVAVGTVRRWIELKNVPRSYCFELMKLSGVCIDYSKFNFKEKDQFFTPSKTTEYCYSKFLNIINIYGDDERDYIYIEPSAGNGSFLNRLPVDRRLGLDIESTNTEITICDYLNWSPIETTNKKYIVIGNPPFGLRGQLALKFINHSYNFADYVCFILPQLFESDGKGAPRKRVKGFNLIHSEKLDTDFEEPGGKKIKVECIFQVWSKHHSNPEYDIKNIDTTNMRIYSLSDGSTPSTTRNKKMFDICDAYIPSTCFGKENMRYYRSFRELPNGKGYGIVFLKNKSVNLQKFKQIEWSNVSFLSTNSAYNIRTSQITEQFKLE
jgi:hypothetical protein